MVVVVVEGGIGLRREQKASAVQSYVLESANADLM